MNFVNTANHVLSTVVRAVFGFDCKGFKNAIDQIISLGAPSMAIKNVIGEVCYESENSSRLIKHHKVYTSR